MKNGFRNASFIWALGLGLLTNSKYCLGEYPGSVASQDGSHYKLAKVGEQNHIKHVTRGK